MFCENLKYYRNRAKISQANLAKALGVSQQAVAKWELGTASPAPDMIASISKSLSVSIEDLFLHDGKRISNRLTWLRLKSGYKTQQDLADVLGINQTAISQWERGVTLPSTSMLIKLSELYGVSTDFLLSHESEAETIISKLESLTIPELAEIISKSAQLIKDKQ